MNLVTIAGVGSIVLAGAALAVRANLRVRDLISALEGPGAATSTPRPSVIERIGSLRVAARWRSSAVLHRRLVLAGGNRTPEEIVGWRLLLALSAPPVLLAVTPATSTLLAAPLFALAASRLPDLWLVRAGRRRQLSIEQHLLGLVELLVATAEAGLAPAVAITRAQDVLHGALSEEAARVAAEVELGVPWRDALAHLAERTESPAVRRLVVTVARSGRIGGSVRGALRAVASELRAERRASLEEQARRAPVKMLFPLVFMVLPAFLLLTVGPVVIATLRSLQSGG